jgi:precorrin-6B methylase 2
MKEFSPDEIKYLLAHENEDLNRLLLQASRYPHLPVPLLVQHIRARQKIKNKLPTWYQHPQVRYPAMVSVEQSSSEKTAAFKAELVSGNLLLDLTGGLGLDSFFFSDKFKKVIYLERQPELVEIAAHNAQVLGNTNIEFRQGEASAFLDDFTSQADWIYLDPARRDEANRKVFNLTDCEPDVVQLLPKLLAKGKNILIKTSPMLDISQALGQLESVQKVYVVAVDNECKEVLYHVAASENPNLQVETINLSAGVSKQTFTFDYAAEENAPVTYTLPQTYIYEPNAAILKAGGFKSLAKYYGLNKLHRNSHLYTSEGLVPDFPGRIFKLRTISRYQKKELACHLPDSKANITVRNFPDSVAAIRKKTGLKEGGDIYLFATTDLNAKPIILICEKVLL